MAGLTDISLGNFTDIIYAPTGTAIPPADLSVGDVFAAIGDVQTVGDISDEATIVDVQAYGQKYLKKLVGSANAAAIEVVCNYDPSDASQTDLLTAYSDSTKRNVAIVMLENDTGNNGTYNAFEVLVASSSVSNSFDETRTITFSLVPTNGIGIYQSLT